jgi:peptidoglycan/xylan/chitin deacetylase (PgdA/CDA1 family)
MRPRNTAAAVAAGVVVGGVLIAAASTSGTRTLDDNSQPSPSAPTKASDQEFPGPAKPKRAKAVKTKASVRTKQKVFFVTIDDGNVKSQAALRYVKKTQMPVTAFLTESAVGGDWKYFRKLTSYGGSIENHTMTHRSLPSLGAAELRDEICTPQNIYRTKFGTAPTMLRPPYGNGGYPGDPAAVRARITSTAASCGIDRIAMWNVVVGSEKVEYVRPPLRRGDIVLLHFGPNLANDLEMVMKLGERQGLRPASLADFL